jgi:hypothetical protein
VLVLLLLLLLLPEEDDDDKGGTGIGARIKLAELSGSIAAAVSFF